MSNQIFYVKTCPRCGKGAKYIVTTAAYIRNLQLKWTDRCKYCKPVPDTDLEHFKKSFYVKQCPECGKDVQFKNRTNYMASVRNNHPCKSCVQAARAVVQAEEQKKLWEPIIGYWGMKYNTFARIRAHWNSLTEEQKQALLAKTPLQRRYYWDHLKRHNAAEGHRKCRETIRAKYSGENHWMKRPNVLRKIRNTCKKYRGDGHWFRRRKQGA